MKRQVKKLTKEQRHLRAFDAAMVGLAKIAKSDSISNQELDRRLIKILDDFDPRQQESLAIAKAFDTARRAVVSLSE